MHPLLSSQLSLFGPGSASPDPGALSAAIDAGYTGYDEQLRTLRRQLAQAGRMASLGQIAASIAHEINNPVAYVCANLEMLHECLAQLQGDAQHAAAPDLLRRELPLLIEESREGMAQVRQIIEDMKTYAHPGADEPQWVWADLHHGIDSTLKLLRNELRHRAELVREYGALPPVRCLPAQLNQVVMNLVVNAAHALGPQPGRITLRTGALDGEVWFAVSDTGCGIAPEHLPRLFDPCFTTKPAGQGTGLGLSLVRDIVHRHGGRIDVSSAPGQGSTFRVVLPHRHAT